MPGVNETGIKYTSPEILCVEGYGQSTVLKYKVMENMGYLLTQRDFRRFWRNSNP